MEGIHSMNHRTNLVIQTFPHLLVVFARIKIFLQLGESMNQGAKKCVR
jgi:hypothetical protein